MADSPTNDLYAEKNRLRAMAKRRRAQAAADAGPAAGEALRDRALAVVDVPAQAIVSGYWPMGDEIDPRPLMRALFDRSHPLCLPVMAGKDRPLVFRAWEPGGPLRPGGFGTQIPAPDEPQRVPGVLLVPLLAFDRAGYRLGYGGGYYDRTLATLRANGRPLLAVGLAYAGQEIERVPHHAADQRLDLVVTERSAVRPADASASAGG